MDIYYKLIEYFPYKLIAGILLGVFSFFFGDLYHQAIFALLMLFVFDAVTGMTASYKEGKPLSSKKGMGGVWKAMVYFSAISAAYFTDLTVPGSFIQMTIISFVGLNEMVSILENIGRMGFHTPQKLLGQLRDLKNDQ